MSETPPSPPTEESKPPSRRQADAPASGASSRPSGVGSGGDPLLGGGVDRVARLQTIAAVVLGLALIAIPLYLWRRPRSESLPVTSSLDASVPVSDAGLAASPAPAVPAAPVVTLSDAKVMECHDTGSRRTRPEDCDHLDTIEKAFAAAIVAGGPCLPTSAGGTLVYVLDASFGRKHHPLELAIPRDGRALKSPRGVTAAVSACSAAVKRDLEGIGMEGIPHAHSRYKIAITATYSAPNAPP